MILITVPYVFGLIAVGSIAWPILYYLFDPKGLRGFPAPSSAALSSIWRIWHNLQQKHYAAVHEAHVLLGTHVRIAPSHISVLHPDAPAQIYGHGANMLKDPWYDAGAGVHRNLADVRNKLEHQGKRKMLAHVFAAKTVLAYEPLLQETLEVFRSRLDDYTDNKETLDMRLYLNYFTIDLFGKLLYGARFDCLSRGDDLLDAQKRDGTVYKVPFIQSLLDATVINTFLAMMPSLLPFTRPLASYHTYKKAGTDWENIIYHNTTKRLANEEGDDLFKRLLQNGKGESMNLPAGEVIAECSAMMNAGTETTTAALTNTVFLLYTHPHILRRLREELDTALPDDRVPTYDAASRCTYLRACIEESLRLRPASSFGLPRIVPEGGRTIAGKFIAAGVTVSVPTYSLLRDSNVFEDAASYVPDRWMTRDSAKKASMMNNHLPFSTGPRACIGRNIAYFEQIVVIATIAKFYDIIIPEGFILETQERFNSNAGNMVINVQRRNRGESEV